MSLCKQLKLGVFGINRLKKLSLLLVKSKTCILYFSRSPEEERAFKKLNKSHKTSSLMINKLYNHGLQVIKSTGLDYICYNEILQEGEGFGEKLSNAIDHTFNLYEQVIIVGNDCPNLHAKDIRSADNAFSANASTLGLTTQGGVYLIALSKEQWNRNVFENLAWNTSDLGAVLTRFLSEQSDLILLDSKAELNTALDFLHFIKRTFNSSFVLDLLELHLYKSYSCDYTTLQNRISIQKQTLFRGPPTFLAA